MSKNSDGGPTFNVDVTNVVDSNIPPTILRQTLLRDQLIHRLLGLLPESYIPHEHMRETFWTAIRKVWMQQALTEPEAQMLLSLCWGLDSDHAYFRDLKEALIKLVRGIRLKGIAPHIDSHLKWPDKAEDDLDLLLKLFLVAFCRNLC